MGQSLTMQAPQFNVGQHNALYEGDFDPFEIEWLSLCARDKVRNIAALLGERRPDSVLEVGCGTGAVLAAVAAAGIGNRHVGVDMAYIEQHRDPSAAGLALSAYDGVTLPFPDDSFDLVYASHVLEHVPDERGFLAELRRVARAFVYIEVPCELVLRTNAAALQRTLDIGHINAYTPDSFVLTLATSGLHVDQVGLFDHSKAVHRHHSGPLKGALKRAVRGPLLRVSPSLASKLFCYHCGALSRPA
jgi:SAM-dependent methyltransferase